MTVDGGCSHEIKRHLLLGRKAMTNLDSILKSRDITLPTVVYIVKAMVFAVVIYRCESWTIKKAEHQRIDAFKLWSWKTPFFSFFKVFIYLPVPGLSCGMWDLVPWPGIKLGPPALGEWSISHWTTREVPGRLVRVSWKARRSNQSILRELNPEYSLKDWCWS